MTFYISSENQTLLWNTISSTPIFINIFGGNISSDTNFKRDLLSRNSLTMKEGQDWFRTVIQKIYQANKNIKQSQLQQLNKVTISYMINDLKQILQQTSPQVVNQLPTASNGSDPMSKLQTQVIIPEQKTNISAFEQRQKEYESMFKRPPPPEVNFLEKTQTEDNSNVDDRLKRHMEEREAELSKYAPPIFPNGATKTPITSDDMNIDPTQFLKPVNTNITNNSNSQSNENSSVIMGEINSLKQQINNIEKMMQLLVNTIHKKEENNITFSENETTHNVEDEEETSE